MAETSDARVRPRVLIEDWLPVTELGIESVRESAPIPGQFPKLKTLHVWWARRPLVASAGAVLTSLLPAWTPELAERFADTPELANEAAYRKWVLTMCGILGDPIAASQQTKAAIERDERIPNPYTYKPAFKNNPTLEHVTLLQEILQHSWGHIPKVLDPTAGGGSIPFESNRYRLPTGANDLNGVATAIMRAGVETPVQYGIELRSDLGHWGGLLVGRLTDRLAKFFPSGRNEQVATFLFSRVVDCPITGKPVPLVGDWSLRRASKGKPAVAVKLHTHTHTHTHTLVSNIDRGVG